ncbi:MAG: arginine--tRNA ligase [Anaerolineaceae bacterium]|jgi:arginyl-tRNA synthetase|nr:arginine--tRNA ligase [Anaerolineaceae bacterium]
MFEQEQEIIAQQIKAYCLAQGLPDLPLLWKWIPFNAHWGISTSFFQLAAADAKEKGQKVNVAARAQELAEGAAAHLGQPAGFDRLEAVRGYLNLYFSTPAYAQRVLDTVLEQGENFGENPSTGEKVMVEFSQPNTHKAFHVGHLRNVILGDAVCNLLEGGGNTVVRTNYIGDIGLHVIKWLWNYLENHDGEVPGDEKIRWMGDIYSEADRLYQDPAVEEQVRALFARWDRKEEDIVELWEITREWSMEGFQQIYDLLGVHFDHFYYESDVEDSGKEIVDLLIEKGLARDERPEGAVIVPLDEILGTEEVYRVLVVLRSDGTSLYATKDLALAIDKFEQYGLDRSVYVIDVRQSLYMKQIFKTLELLGYEWAEDCQHLAYEIVNLPGNVTMSSRDGTVVLLEDLLKEAVARTLTIVQEKNPDLTPVQQQEVAQAVALGALKYSMLSRDNTKIVTFDWETALDFNGQAAPYIQYAAVRCNSILRKLDGGLPASAPLNYALEEAEVHLIDLISRLPNEVERASRELKPLYVATHAYELAKGFSNFYNTCPVLKADEPMRSHRLRIVAAARVAIANSLAFLGIQSPDVM